MFIVGASEETASFDNKSGDINTFNVALEKAIFSSLPKAESSTGRRKMVLVAPPIVSQHVNLEALRLVRAARECLFFGIAEIRPGQVLRAIGKAVEKCKSCNLGTESLVTPSVHRCLLASLSV